ncbi:netrin receptor DCC [Pseudorasbora parva]|uniref:netrin receptor DCC n=1 Tax=Pseudorasbora parva TaxID=51549 RepID=UPI00351DD31A
MSERAERKKRTRLMSSDGMSLCVVLLCAGLHFTTGCTEEFPYVSCRAGESVLLRCRDENAQEKHVQWLNSDFDESRNSVDVIKDQRYKDRVQIDRNLSLSITHLTVDDSGLYWCNFSERVRLIVEGCSISGNEASVEISRYSGDSVFLSCSVECSARYNPDVFRWTLPNDREINRSNSAELSRLHQGRFHMFDVQSGNFSLLISNLTEKDEGRYNCWINDNQQKSFNLTVIIIFQQLCVKLG